MRKQLKWHQMMLRLNDEVMTVSPESVSISGTSGLWA